MTSNKFFRGRGLILPLLSPGFTLSPLGGLLTPVPTLIPGRGKDFRFSSSLFFPNNNSKVFTVLNILRAWLEEGPTKEPKETGSHPVGGWASALPNYFPQLLFTAQKAPKIQKTG